MNFIVKSSNRWENGFYYCELSLRDIMELFFNDDGDEQLDDMLEGIVNLPISGIFTYELFMNDVYTFRRIA